MVIDASNLGDREIAEQITVRLREDPCQPILVLCKDEVQADKIGGYIDSESRPFVQYVWNLDEDEKIISKPNQSDSG